MLFFHITVGNRINFTLYPIGDRRMLVETKNGIINMDFCWKITTRETYKGFALYPFLLSRKAVY